MGPRDLQPAGDREAVSDQGDGSIRDHSAPTCRINSHRSSPAFHDRKAVIQRFVVLTK